MKLGPKGVCQHEATVSEKEKELSVLMGILNWFSLSPFSCRSNSHAPEDVLPACETTLKNLQIDYLDLYLVLQNLIFCSENSYVKIDYKEN